MTTPVPQQPGSASRDRAAAALTVADPAMVPRRLSRTASWLADISRDLVTLSEILGDREAGLAAERERWQSLKDWLRFQVRSPHEPGTEDPEGAAFLMVLARMAELEEGKTW